MKSEMKMKSEDRVIRKERMKMGNPVWTENGVGFWVGKIFRWFPDGIREAGG